jgi:hypothetical protein
VISKNGLITDFKGKILLTDDVLEQIDDIKDPRLGQGKKLPIFETKTLDPYILIEPYKKNGIPKIKLLLAAKKGNVVSPILKSKGILIDYLIDCGTWNPLPRGTTTAFYSLCKECGVIDQDNITVGSYLKIISSNSFFSLQDNTNQLFSSTNLQNIIKQDIDSHLSASPYEYQRVGISWINFMASQNVGCILADEMGLG